MAIQTGLLPALMSIYSSVNSPEKELSSYGKSNTSHQVILNETSQRWTILGYQVLEICASCNTAINQSEWLKHGLKSVIYCMKYNHQRIKKVETFPHEVQPLTNQNDWNSVQNLYWLQHNHQPIRMTETLSKSVLAAIQPSYQNDSNIA